MCQEEFERTIKYGVPDFSEKRFKYFSPDLNFILQRVKDGNFNNSKHCPNRYSKIVSFSIDKCYNQLEVQIDRRQNLKIQVLKEL